MKTYSELNGYNLLVPGDPSVDGSFAIRGVKANNAGAADRWLQAHAGTAIPANGAVPLFAPIFLPLNYITAEDYPEGRRVPAPGIVLVVSSTRATLTADAAATVDLSVDVDEFELPVAGTSIAGDFTTARKALEVWAAAAGPKTLLSAQVKNLSAGTLYVQLHTVDAPADGAVPLRSWAVGAGLWLNLGFGGGLMPFQQTAARVAQQGCRLVLSSTQNTKTATALDNSYMRATYK